YYSLVESRSYQLPPVRNYRNYIAWLQQQDIEQSKRYWIAELAGFRHATPLIENAPHNRGRSGTGGFAKQYVEFEVSAPHTVKELIRQSGVTMSVVFQLSWALLLARYTGQHDVLFGVMSTGRHPEFEGIEEIVGPAINTLPMRIRLLEDENVLQILKQIQAKQLRLTKYDYTPLKKVREWSGLADNQILFESYMIVQNLGSYFDIAIEMDEDEIPLVNEYGKSLAIFNSGTPLRIDVVGTLEGSCQIYMTYLKARFRDESILQMLSDLQNMFNDLCLHPHQSIASLISATPEPAFI
ncbi:condensation domain-containing protein, partial [Paenibacillus sp.]|uniref:condensation domain-containing protein n=1 Tax=Paenibacillus sp. TaxID=58172 RepID=UPI003464E013